MLVMPFQTCPACERWILEFWNYPTVEWNGCVVRESTIHISAAIVTTFVQRAVSKTLFLQLRAGENAVLPAARAGLNDHLKHYSQHMEFQIRSESDNVTYIERSVGDVQGEGARATKEEAVVANPY